MARCPAELVNRRSQSALQTSGPVTAATEIGPTATAARLSSVTAGPPDLSHADATWGYHEAVSWSLVTAEMCRDQSKNMPESQQIYAGITAERCRGHNRAVLGHNRAVPGSQQSGAGVTELCWDQQSCDGVMRRGRLHIGTEVTALEIIDRRRLATNIYVFMFSNFDSAALFLSMR